MDVDLGVRLIRPCTAPLTALGRASLKTGLGSTFVFFTFQINCHKTPLGSTLGRHISIKFSLNKFGFFKII